MSMVYAMTVEESKAWAEGGPSREAIEKKAWDLGSLEIQDCTGKRVWIMDAARPMHLGRTKW